MSAPSVSSVLFFALALVLLVGTLGVFGEVSDVGKKKNNKIPPWRRMGSGYCEEDFLRTDSGAWTAKTCKALCSTEKDCVFISVIPGAQASGAGAGVCSRYGEFTSCSVRVNGAVGSWENRHVSYRYTKRLNFDLISSAPTFTDKTAGVCPSAYLNSTTYPLITNAMTVSDCMGECLSTNYCAEISVSANACKIYSACSTISPASKTVSYPRATRTVASGN